MLSPSWSSVSALAASPTGVDIPSVTGVSNVSGMPAVADIPAVYSNGVSENYNSTHFSLP
jgi:hypothetical protein